LSEGWESLVDLAVAVIVLAIAQFGNWNMRSNTTDAQLVGGARHVPKGAFTDAFATGQVATHRIGGIAAIRDEWVVLVHPAVAVVVQTVARNLGNRRDGANARAPHPGRADLKSGLAGPNAGPSTRGRIVGATGGRRGIAAEREIVDDAVAVIVDPIADLGRRSDHALANNLLASRTVGRARG
jgi:hypothetical protein